MHGETMEFIAIIKMFHCARYKLSKTVNHKRALECTGHVSDRTCDTESCSFMFISHYI